MKRIIRLEDVRFYGFHGAFKEEENSGNSFVLNVVVTTEVNDLLSDDLSETVDYCVLNDILHEEMSVRSLLMEHVIQRIINRIELKNFKIDELFISMKKLNPTFGGNCRASVVEIEKTY
jgi:dihydroneopterin aldolase